MVKSGDDPYGFELPVASPTRPPRSRPGGVRLYVDLVPTSAWLTNLQAELSGLEWRLCSAFVMVRADHRCEACGARNGRMDCHERWSFDEVAGVQRLTSLQALCSWCHQATHIGSAQGRAQFRFAAAHMSRVNGWTDAQFRDHLEHALDICRRRSDRAWMVDARHLLIVPISWSERTRGFVERHAALLQLAVTGGRQQCISLLSSVESDLPEEKGD